MRRWSWIALLVLLGWGALGWWRHRPLHPLPGVLAAKAPAQMDLDQGTLLQRGDITLHTRAHVALTARVLSRKDYRFDAGADLAPTDLALGWGRMSDSAVLSQIEIGQSSRFYHWHVDAFPIPRREIETSSANMHLIPADEAVRRAMDRVRAGELVRIEGFLVDASRADGWRWRTSLTREDTGNGACELVYVEALEPVPL
ncbi:hypothetical protein [Frateuria sp. STR12]|uniref:hypothetical protein n=1 Tax=Frateuria hangzhouensis TaxID=2995589 RepID=UPI002260FDA5|nr:hypothetical protein [Frateuria sp. STR12]MCX7514047.1 hypothetical protein [Frateuria sp. STR12]